MIDDKPAGDAVRFEYTLRHPVDVRDKHYATLVVRRPRVRDLIEAERQPGAVGSSAALLAICADVPIADFGHVDAGDFRSLLQQGERLGFFPGAGESGGTSSS